MWYDCMNQVKINATIWSDSNVQLLFQEYIANIDFVLLFKSYEFKKCQGLITLIKSKESRWKSLASIDQMYSQMYSHLYSLCCMFHMHT